jgi:hypothetical protein
VLDPEVPKLLSLLFGIQSPPSPRNDLVTIFLTGIPGLNQPPGVRPSEMLRLNTGIAPVFTPNPLGVLGGDVAGFPNGRRLTDDVVDIALRAMAGATPLTPTFNTGINAQLGDGVAANDKAVPFCVPVRRHAARRQQVGCHAQGRLLLAISLAAVGAITPRSPVARRCRPNRSAPLARPARRAPTSIEPFRNGSPPASKPDDASANLSSRGRASSGRLRVLTHSAPAVKAERGASQLPRTHTGRPYQYQAQRLLATALASQHRFERPSRKPSAVLQVRPDDAVLYGIIGDSKLELGDREAAFRGIRADGRAAAGRHELRQSCLRTRAQRAIATARFA